MTTKTQIANSDLSINNKRKEILELQKYFIDQRQRYQNSLFVLKSSIEDWLKKYVVVAPDDGKLVFLTSLQDNIYVNSGQELFYVQRTKEGVYAELMVPQKGFGKIKHGQKVIIKVDGFPFEEYGYIFGNVNHISDLPNRRDSFLIKVSLKDGLRTNRRKKLDFTNHMSAQADIVTEDKSLLFRFFSDIQKALNAR